MDERRANHPLKRRSREINIPGRRRTDFDPRTTISRKLLVITVVVGNALYLAGEALIFNGSICQ
jgi:hypothetical protein